MNPEDHENYQKMLELWFLFCLIWSIGASVDEDSRKKMDTFIRELEGQFPAKVRLKCHVVVFLPSLLVCNEKKQVVFEAIMSVCYVYYVKKSVCSHCKHFVLFCLL